jgi:hypothetical protein
MTNTDRINEIRARLEAATSGPWEEDGPVVRSVQTGEDVTGLCESENRDFIAHAPDDIAYLLARVECGDALREAVRRFLYVNSDNPPLGYANLDNATDAYDAEPTGKPEKPVVYCGNCRKRGIERRVDFNWYEEKKEWLGGTWHLDNSYESCSLNDEPFCGFAEPTKKFCTEVLTESHYAGMDEGVRFAVRVLNAHFVSTYQSCEGGEGHSADHPYIDVAPMSIHHAVEILNSYGLKPWCAEILWNIDSEHGMILDGAIGRVQLRKAVPERADEEIGFAIGYQRPILPTDKGEK